MHQSFCMRVVDCRSGKMPWFTLGLALASFFGQVRTACCEEPANISAAGDRPFWAPSEAEPAMISDANTPARLTPEEPAATRPSSPRPLTCCNPNIPRPGHGIHPTLAALAEAVRPRHQPGSTSSAPVPAEPVGEEGAAALTVESPSTEMPSAQTPSADLPPIAAPAAEARPPEILSPETPPVAAPAAVAPEVPAPSGPLPSITTPSAYEPPPARQALGEANFAPTRELQPNRSPVARDASPWADRPPYETAPDAMNRPQPRGGAEPRSRGFGAPQAAPAGLREPPAIPKSVPAKVIENPYAASRVQGAAEHFPSAPPPVRLVRYGEPETRQPQELPPAAASVQMTAAPPAATRAPAPQSPLRGHARAELAPRIVEPAAAATIRAAGVVDSRAPEDDTEENPLRWAAKRTAPRPAQWSSGNPLR